MEQYFEMEKEPECGGGSVSDALNIMELNTRKILGQISGDPGKYLLTLAIDVMALKRDGGANDALTPVSPAPVRFTIQYDHKTLDEILSNEDDEMIKTAVMNGLISFMRAVKASKNLIKGET